MAPRASGDLDSLNGIHLARERAGPACRVAQCRASGLDRRRLLGSLLTLAVLPCLGAAHAAEPSTPPPGEEEADGGSEEEDFGFDGEGRSVFQYAPASVVALAQAGEGAILFLQVDGFEQPMRLAVGAAEAVAVLGAAQEQRGRRPATHEAWGLTLAAVGWKVERLAVTSMAGGTFFGRLVLSRQTGQPVDVAAPPPEGQGGVPPPPGGGGAGGGPALRSIDLRPSDGIALALRCRAPVFVARDVAQGVLRKQKKKLFAGGPGPPGGGGAKAPPPWDARGLLERGDTLLQEGGVRIFVEQQRRGFLTFLFNEVPQARL